MATPGVGPAGYPYPAPLTGFRSQPATPDNSHNFMEIDKDRMAVLVKNFHGSIGVLYSDRNPLYKQLANSIMGYYSTSYYFSGTEVINYDDPGWLDVSLRYTHLIFVGIPPTKRRTVRKGSKTASLDSASREEELMSRDNRKLSTVVVINPAMPRSKTEKRGHFLERFFHIHLPQPSDLLRLAQTAFAVFAGKRGRKEVKLLGTSCTCSSAG